MEAKMEDIVKNVRHSARNYRIKKKKKGKLSTNDEAPISKQMKGSLSKNLPNIMYGFGDAKQPSLESVDCVETLVLERMALLAARCVENQTSSVSGQQGKVKISAEDLLFEIRKDKRKHSRCQELLRLNEEIKQAKKSYEKPEMLEDK